MEQTEHTEAARDRGELRPHRNGTKPGTRNHFDSVANQVVGKEVLIADPSALSEGPVGYKLGTNFYPAKVLSRDATSIKIARRFEHIRGTSRSEEVVREFIPLKQIKRVSCMKGQIILHL